MTDEGKNDRYGPVFVAACALVCALAAGSVGGGVAAIFHDLQHVQEEGHNYAREQCDRARDRYGDSAALLRHDGGSDGDSGEAQEETQEDHASDIQWCELATQQRIAIATDSSKRAAWTGLIVTFLGVVFAGLAALFTSRAAYHAKNAARATWQNANTAEQALRITRELGQVQVRAYLSISTWDNTVTEWHLKKSVILIPMLRNSGQSPATVSSIKIAVYQVVEDDEPHRIRTGVTKPTIIGPGEQIRAYTLIMDADLVNGPVPDRSKYSVRLTLDFDFWDEFGDIKKAPNRHGSQVFHIRFDRRMLGLTKENLGEALRIDSEV